MNNMNKKNLLILTIIFSILFVTALIFEKFENNKIAVINFLKKKKKKKSN
jgi:hypothetical protein